MQNAARQFLFQLFDWNQQGGTLSNKRRDANAGWLTWSVDNFVAQSIWLIDPGDRVPIIPD